MFTKKGGNDGKTHEEIKKEIHDRQKKEKVKPFKRCTKPEACTFKDDWVSGFSKVRQQDFKKCLRCNNVTYFGEKKKALQ